jgi:hypothetical protein
LVEERRLGNSFVSESESDAERWTNWSKSDDWETASLVKSKSDAERWTNWSKSDDWETASLVKSKSDAERWPSGRRRSLGKRVMGNTIREFESRLLRQTKKARQRRAFLVCADV